MTYKFLLVTLLSLLLCNANASALIGLAGQGLCNINIVTGEARSISLMRVPVTNVSPDMNAMTFNLK